MLVKNAVDLFLVARSDLSPATLSDYRHYLTLYTRWLPDNAQLEEPGSVEIQAFMHHMTNTYRTRSGGLLSAAGLDNCYIALRSFWRWCSETYPVTNISTALKRPKKPVKRVEPFDKADVQALLNACVYTAPTESETRRNYHYRRIEAERDTAILFVLLDTGVRIGELSRLNIEDIDTQRGALTVEPHLSGIKSKARTIPFTQDTRLALLTWYAVRREQPGEPLSPTGELLPDSPVWTIVQARGQGRRMQDRTIAHILTRLGERAGVENVHAHRFRHTFAIEYLRNGGDPFTLQDLLGHSSMDMVRRYLALTQADRRAAHSRASAVARWRLRVPK